MAAAARVNRALRRLPVWPVHLGNAGWAGWLFWQALSGALGPDPVRALVNGYGEGALWLLIAGLAITPLWRFCGINLVRFRRAIGLSCFFLMTAHLLFWAALDAQTLARIWADITGRPYITVGMVGFLLLVPLAATSNDLSVRRLGSAWRRLHRLVYPAAVLSVLHYLMLVKGWQMKPVVMFALVIILLGLRLPFLTRVRRAAKVARYP